MITCEEPAADAFVSPPKIREGSMRMNITGIRSNAVMPTMTFASGFLSEMAAPAIAPQIPPAEAPFAAALPVFDACAAALIRFAACPAETTSFIPLLLDSFPMAIPPLS